MYDFQIINRNLKIVLMKFKFKILDSNINVPSTIKQHTQAILSSREGGRDNIARKVETESRANHVKGREL